MEDDNFTATSVDYILEKVRRMADEKALVIVYPVSESSVQEYAHTLNAYSFYARLDNKWQQLED